MFGLKFPSPIDNPVIQTMLNRRSVCEYKKDQPPDAIIETIVRAGQQAPFASQLYSRASFR